MIDPAWRRVRRLVAVRLDNLGDVLVTTPAIHAIKTALPEVEITLLASAAGAQAGRLNADIADLIVHEAAWVDPWAVLPHDSERERELIERLRAGEFDAAVIFTSFRQSPLPAAYACYLAGIPLRLAASIDGSGSLLTTRHRHADALVHEVERGLNLVGAVGIPPADDRLVLTISDAARRRARLRRAELIGMHDGPMVIVHPGCSMPARTYPADQYVEAIADLVRELGATVALTGTDAEHELVEGIVAELPLDIRARVHDLSGELEFEDLCALIRVADLVVTNNTGPMHIAAATATPTVVMFALTNPPEQWRPWRVPHRLLNHDVPCRLCYRKVCPYSQECISTVSAGEIVTAARDLLRMKVTEPARAFEGLPK
jgi:ADP-heptose:LPS heptosyltransferase